MVDEYDFVECPFCGEAYDAEEFMKDYTDEDGEEPYQCACGAWFYAMIPDEVSDDARRD